MKKAAFRISLAAGSLCIFILLNACGAKPTLTLEKTDCAPGESISVKFTAPSTYVEKAWVGIIPSDIPHGSEAENDKHDLAYQYLNKKTEGTLIFKAPWKQGSYDLRMNDTDDNGNEVASVTFKVAGDVGTGTLKLNKTKYRKGREIKVEFTASDKFPRNAWVGIIPSNIAHGSEAVNDQHDLAYQYLENRTSGTLIFKAPNKSGSYDIRMHNTDDNGVEVGSVTFTVK